MPEGNIKSHWGSFTHRSCRIRHLSCRKTSNGHQECTFSTPCTHFNDNLCQNLKPEKFEQTVLLLAANKENACVKILTEEEAKAIVEEDVNKVKSSEVDKDAAASLLESLKLDGLEDGIYHNVAISLAEPHQLFYSLFAVRPK
jgi:hypothetical protein